ncbi:cytochrome P450 81D1-like [Cucurbita pepo subsp. pepo]|uniref:cytochrome P450 81D1-like n=1 Tax=Cucurbita pepo subsp. pepo TaxID=3664 RepID=UPI000C9D9C24|nr:cytochrome P450 81D1-like [Cucurbita pepo subsp. pepo]
MENLMLCLCLPLMAFISALIFLLRPSTKLPPSPPFSLPIIGHLYLLKRPVHQTLQKLSNKYGHVFTLRLGSQLVVVVSSPSVVKECFTMNDIILANRPSSNIIKHLTYNNTIFSASPYGDHWRELRRISTIEIFSATRLNMFLETRKDEIKHLLGKLCCISSDSFVRVEMSSMISELSSNIVMRMVMGKRFYGEGVSDLEQARKFRDIVKQVMQKCGSFDSRSFIPLLNWIDITHYEKRIIKLGQRNDEFLQGLIDEHRNQKEEGRNTMIDHLLSLQQSQLDFMSDQVIKGLITVILLAGTDTIAVTIEWALSHLLNNPNVLKKARIELDSIIGQERLVEESDMSKLSYLQGVISETLRLNPAAPLLVPHYASENCSIAGYEIPRDTIILINAWAIHRDPNIWEDANTFNPERYKITMVDDLYKLIPFGLGRRACPGVGMAHRVVGLSLASLIQCFEWKRVSSELVDMTEGVGLTIPRAQPLEAMCKSRPIVERVLM